MTSAAPVDHEPECSGCVVLRTGVLYNVHAVWCRAVIRANCEFTHTLLSSRALPAWGTNDLPGHKATSSRHFSIHGHATVYQSLSPCFECVGSAHGDASPELVYAGSRTEMVVVFEQQSSTGQHDSANCTFINSFAAGRSVAANVTTTPCWRLRQHASYS